MRKFQYLLFVLKRSYICCYMISMTVPLNMSFDIDGHLVKLGNDMMTMHDLQNKLCVADEIK